MLTQWKTHSKLLKHQTSRKHKIAPTCISACNCSLRAFVPGTSAKLGRVAKLDVANVSLSPSKFSRPARPATFTRDRGI